MYRTGICFLGLLLAGCQGHHGTPRTHDHRVFSGRLPPMQGDSLRTEMLEVTYGPGDSSRPHRHPCAVVGYVLHGSLRIRVQGDTERTIRVGQAFYEPPMALHLVSANASATEPARFLAVFTCDHAGPLSLRQDGARAGGRGP